MSGFAPLCVPVELSRAGAGAAPPRWFRLAVAVSPDGLTLRLPVPEELRRGPVAMRFHLPPIVGGVAEAAGPLLLHGEAGPPEDEEDEARGTRRLLFRGLTEAERAPLLRYVEARLALPA